MSIQENKETVRRYLAHFRDAAVPDLLEAMTDDATWWILGKPHLFAGAGSKSKDDMARIWRGLFSHMKDGLEMTVIGLVGEEDRVAAEIRSHADLNDGRVYENQYHMLFTLERGKIAEVREYADTLLIKDMFG